MQFFAILISTIMFKQEKLTFKKIIACLIGFAGMLAGTFIGKLTRSKMKPQMIKKAVYAVMACSGALNVITYFI